MTRAIEGQTEPEDLDFDLSGLSEPTDVLEPGTRPDAEAMQVSLRRINRGGEDCVEVYAHGEARLNDETETTQQSVLLARVTERELTMFPLVSASYRPAFLTPKYDELTTITVLGDVDSPWHLPEDIDDFDGMLDDLPTGFGRHAKYGLGFRWEYRLIPDAILEIEGVTELVIEPGNDASVELPKFKLGLDRFAAIKRSIDSITNRARAQSLHDRRLLAFNELLHEAEPQKFERRFAKVKPGEIYELVKLGGRSQKRSANDTLAAAAVVCEDAAKVAAEQPAELLKLKSVIEHVTLKELILKIEEMLTKNLPEPKWQAFFKANPFVLSLAFAHPVFLVQEQAYVGGTMLKGAGESIVDFLFAQRFTGSLALIEIKRPSMPLIERKTFRGDLHAPHKDLTSAMAQALDQRYQLMANFLAKSHDPSLKNTHAAAVQCVVVAGRTPAAVEQKRSFDLFRHSSKDVTVLTFDELLEKLREILRLMSSTGALAAQPLGVAEAADDQEV